MKAVKVEYTVKEEFTEKNKENIQKVIKQLKQTGLDGLQYSSWIKEDKKTFVHIFMSQDDKENPLLELEAFKQFQTELKENAEVPPKVESLNRVGSSFEL